MSGGQHGPVYGHERATDDGPADRDRPDDYEPPSLRRHRPLTGLAVAGLADIGQEDFDLAHAVDSTWLQGEPCPMCDDDGFLREPEEPGSMLRVDVPCPACTVEPQPRPLADMVPDGLAVDEAKRCEPGTGWVYCVHDEGLTPCNCTCTCPGQNHCPVLASCAGPDVCAGCEECEP